MTDLSWAIAWGIVAGALILFLIVITIVVIGGMATMVGLHMKKLKFNRPFDHDVGRST